ncbi:hypothetical protein D9611_006162 [Ephemerocybe angulata]|uniref:Lipoprotein n=1 Tax=Ephemerocybe angulata TaxID=980116 RepID=A0A8H5CI73_9AGAR|nr:hypothetical protein D9611_006162 [Tulosesus angulatus]
MWLTLRPLITLFLGVGSLVLSVTCSHNGVAERSFGGYDMLDARETVDVPFQPSLRAFLEDAVAAHRRAVQEYDDLEARAKPFTLWIELRGAKVQQHIMRGVTPDTTISDVQRAVAGGHYWPGVVAENIRIHGPDNLGDHGYLGSDGTLGQKGIRENFQISATVERKGTQGKGSPPGKAQQKR